MIYGDDLATDFYMGTNANFNAKIRIEIALNLLSHYSMRLLMRKLRIKLYL